jgi:hypothetical protein
MSTHTRPIRIEPTPDGFAACHLDDAIIFIRQSTGFRFHDDLNNLVGGCGAVSRGGADWSSSRGWCGALPASPRPTKVITTAGGPVLPTSSCGG